ncbi:MAG: iron ABC transporter permease [Bradyrhizobium sp.]|uniref:ABC transporter permease n=1 Tax=Bradyrhizobium sp. TaxID=376 RepID=UPI001DACC233|nr:iron ABC transporter permease [Bradyrhizobium sp.]MBV9563475.1 iron ABC transporter permease [Bradyrhizobium sp.]
MIAISRRDSFPLAIAILAFAFLGLFLLYPLLNVFGASFLDRTGKVLTLANYVRILSSSFYLGSLGNSLILGILSTLLTIAIGVPLAFCLARLPIPGKSALLALASLPLVLPSFVAAYALVLLLGRAGIVTRLLRDIGVPFSSIYGVTGMTIVFAMTLFPFAVFPTLAAFKAVDVSVEEAGQNLGASRWRTFRTVTLPIVMPAVLAGGLLVFIEVIESFGVPFVLAEDKPVLAVEAYKLFVGETGNPASAGVLGVLLIVCTAIALLIQRHYLGRRRFSTATRRPPPELVVKPWLRRLACAYSWGVVLISLVPFFAIIVISLMEFRGPVMQSSPSLNNFRDLFGQSWRPLINTLSLSTAAAVTAAVIGVPIGFAITRFRSRVSDLLDVLAMTPFAVAGTVLAIGLIISFNSGGLVLTGGWLILVLAWVVRKIPFNVRASAAILYQIDPSLEEASINLGVSPPMTFVRLTVPLMMGGVIGGMVLTWVTVASELSSTVVLYSGPWATMTVVMFQALEGTGAGIASAAATVLIVFTVLPVALVYRLLRRHELGMM